MEAKEPRVLILYVNRGDKEILIPKQLENQRFIVAVSPSYLIDGGLSESPRGIEQINELLDSEKVLLGQRGTYKDKCSHSHKKTFLGLHFATDPWHETYSCLYHKSPDICESSAQLKEMKLGRRVLEDKFGVKPESFHPINHLWTNSLLHNADILDFNFFFVRNQIGIKSPYDIQSGLKIFPEVKLPDEATRKTSAMYADLGSIQRPEVLEILSRYELVLPSEIEAQDIGTFRQALNHTLSNSRKIARDVKGLFK
jgi:hypothetical protein